MKNGRWFRNGLLASENQQINTNLAGSYTFVENLTAAGCPNLYDTVEVSMKNDCKGIITGRVHNYITSQRLAGVKLQASNGAITYTDSLGQFEFEILYGERIDSISVVDSRYSNYKREVFYDLRSEYLKGETYLFPVALVDFDLETVNFASMHRPGFNVNYDVRVRNYGRVDTVTYVIDIWSNNHRVTIFRK